KTALPAAPPSAVARLRSAAKRSWGGCGSGGVVTCAARGSRREGRPFGVPHSTCAVRGRAARAATAGAVAALAARVAAAVVGIAAGRRRALGYAAAQCGALSTRAGPSRDAEDAAGVLFVAPDATSASVSSIAASNVA